MMREDHRSTIASRCHPHHSHPYAGLVAGLLMLALIAPAGPAQAGNDENDKPYPPSWHFSGLYLSVFLGHFNPSLHAKQNGASLKTMPNNGEVGLSVGYGLRLGTKTVLAIESEISFIDVIDSQGLLDDSLISAILDAIIPDATGGLSARLGHAVTDRLLVYGRAGWSIMSFGSDANAHFNGVRLGGGAEWRIWKGLALRLELIHDEYERKRFSQGLSLRPSATSFRGGLIIHF